MRILAIDTSGRYARWTGVEDGQAVAPVEIELERRHDEVLASGVKEWLEVNEWQPDAVAVVNGPGGYTGLRVGVAFAGALAAGCRIPVIPVSTFSAVAARVPGELAWCLLPLRKGICRGQLMTGGNSPEAVTEPEDVIIGKTVPPTDKPVIPIGEGYELYKDEIDTLLGNQRINDPDRILPESIALASVSWSMWKQGIRINPAELDVEYGGEFRPTSKKREVK